MRFRVLRGNKVALASGKLGCNLTPVRGVVELTPRMVEVYHEAILARVAEGTMRPADAEAVDLCKGNSAG